MPTVKGVLQKYHEGQNIFRREAVACLVARIEQLEKYISSQQGLHLTGGILPPSEPLSPLKPCTGIEYLSHQPTSK